MKLQADEQALRQRVRSTFGPCRRDPLGLWCIEELQRPAANGDLMFLCRLATACSQRLGGADPA
jgi:type IV secretory pathway protease TraF